MSGERLGQPLADGHTEQYEVVPGTLPQYPAPAAGASYSITLQRNDRWRLVFVTWTLTTDSTSGNRYVTVEYPDGTGVSQAADGAAVAVAPSTTAQRFVGSVNRGQSEWNTGTDVFFPLCGLVLEVGRTVTINVAGVGATDTLTKIRFTFDRSPVRDAGDFVQQAVEASMLEAQRVAQLVQAGLVGG